jgi:hypothetical protein
MVATLPEGWELTDLQQGGPYNAWGARLYWQGVLVHALRSYADREDLIRSAREFAERILPAGQPYSPAQLRRWSQELGGLRPDCGGDEVYAAQWQRDLDALRKRMPYTGHGGLVRLAADLGVSYETVLGWRRPGHQPSAANRAKLGALRG